MTSLSSKQPQHNISGNASNNTSAQLTPPPKLTHNASRRLLFDENAAAVPLVYCVYCGEGTPPAELSNHMKECFVFQRTWESKKDTQRIVEGAIMTAWGLNLVNSDAANAAKQDKVRAEKAPRRPLCNNNNVVFNFISIAIVPRRPNTSSCSFPSPTSNLPQRLANTARGPLPWEGLRPTRRFA